MVNQVTKKECLDALEYLWGMGMTTDMTYDKRRYTEILCKKVANIYKIKLEE